MGALASLDGGFFPQRMVLLFDRLFEVEVLVAALFGFVNDGLCLTIAAVAVDKERIATFAGEDGGRFELLHRDFFLKTCRVWSG